MGIIENRHTTKESHYHGHLIKITCKINENKIEMSQNGHGLLRFLMHNLIIEFCFMDLLLNINDFV